MIINYNFSRWKLWLKRIQQYRNWNFTQDPSKWSIRPKREKWNHHFNMSITIRLSAHIVLPYTFKNYFRETNEHPRPAGSISRHSGMQISVLGWIKIHPWLDSNPVLAGFFSLRFLTDNTIIKSRKSYIVGHFFPPTRAGFLSSPGRIYIWWGKDAHVQIDILTLADC